MILIANNAEVIDALEALMRLTMYPRLQQHQVNQVRQHLTWMKRQKSNLSAQVSLSTEPKTLVTEIKFTLAYDRILTDGLR